MKRSVVVVLALAGCEAGRTPSLDPDLAVDVSQLSCAPIGCRTESIDVTTFGSAFQVETRLAGAWRFCGGHDDLGRFAAGIELTPDHEMFVLEAAPDGSCRRSARADWSTLDISEQNPHGTFQLNLEWEDGSFSIFVPGFSTSGSSFVDRFSGYQFAKFPPLFERN